MGARIIDHVGNATIGPRQRWDRSLVTCIGSPPDSMRDEETLSNSWTTDQWGGWETGWNGCGWAIWCGTNPEMDWGPKYLPPMWTFDTKWSGGKQAPYSIKGTIRDNNGNVVSGACVQLVLVSVPLNYAGIGNDLALVVATTYSDANGYYGFAVNDNTTKYKVRAHTQSGGVSAENLVGS